MALTVGFDATAAARQRAGIGRYARELLAALARRGDRHVFRVVYCAGGEGSLPPLDGRFRVRKLPVSDRVMNAVWHRARVPLPVELVAGRFDLFHSPDFSAPPTAGVPTVVTVHDLAFIRHPECAYPTLRTYLEQVVPKQVRRAAHVVVVSQNTKRDVIEILGTDEEKISVISPAVSDTVVLPDPRQARIALAAAGIHSPFILTVGTLEPRKNYVRLLEAYALLRDRGIEHRLVIAGGAGWLYEPVFERLHELNLEEEVTIIRPDDDLLGALYCSADMFVCASIYEGFGIPALEALAAGLPVASSNTSSLPEVVGDAAITFDPGDVEDIADSMYRLVTDSALAADLRASGPIQAARFSWEESAERTVRMYEHVAGHA